MATYEVKGYDETVENVEILGEVKTVGTTVELAEDVAAPLVEEGKLVPLGVEAASNDGAVGSAQENTAATGTEQSANEASRTEGAPSDTEQA